MLIKLKTLIQDHNLSIKGIIHLGAHQGEEAESYEDNQVSDVLWVEGNPELIDGLEKNLKKYPGHIVVNELLSDVDGERLVFRIASNTQASSILELGKHKIYHPSIYNEKEIELYCKRLDTIIKEREIDVSKYNFLNLDLQGAEFKALKGAPKLLAESIEYIYMEVNTSMGYKGLLLLSELDRFLGSLGFLRKSLVMTKHGWGDGFYTKEIKNERFKKLLEKNVVEALQLEAKIKSEERFQFKKRALAFMIRIKRKYINKIFNKE